MDQPTKTTKKEPPAKRKSIFKGQLPLENETTMFIFASFLDVVMTNIVLNTRDTVIESNPIANFVLGTWGFAGMVYYKFGLVCVVCVVTQLIAIKREDLARMILRLGTIGIALVVLYSFALYLLSR